MGECDRTLTDYFESNLGRSLASHNAPQPHAAHEQIGRIVVSLLRSTHPTPILDFVDVGTGSGTNPSVPKFLEAELGSRGLCIDPLAAAHAGIDKNMQCLAFQVALGSQERAASEFFVDGAASFSLSSELLCGGNYEGLALDAVQETQLSRLLFREKQRLFARDCSVHDCVAARDEWLGYLHIDVHGHGLPILLGTFLPLVDGPPMKHEKERYILPQLVGFNTSYLWDVDSMVHLLQDVLAYEVQGRM